jgi:Rieske Fe-S protein
MRTLPGSDRPQRAACDGCTCGSADGAASGTDRRTFLAQGAAALALMALSACGVGGGPTAPSTITATTINLSDYPALANVGGVSTLRINGQPVAVVRESASTFSAFSLICPHAGNTVQAVTNGFYCPGHGAQFNIDGQWTGGQRTSNLRSYPAAYDATAGTITLG